MSDDIGSIFFKVAIVLIVIGISIYRHLGGGKQARSSWQCPPMPALQRTLDVGVRLRLQTLG